MAIIKLKPLNRKDPIFTGHFMTFSNKKRRKNERQTDKTKTRKKKKLIGLKIKNSCS